MYSFFIPWLSKYDYEYVYNTFVTQNNLIFLKAIQKSVGKIEGYN